MKRVVNDFCRISNASMRKSTYSIVLLSNTRENK